MASDAHAHPYDLLQLFPGAETERRSLGIACAASSCTAKDFSFHEAIALAAKNDGSAPVFTCFAVHPQFPAAFPNFSFEDYKNSLDLLASLAAEKRIAAVGEAGFDLYSTEFKDTEKIQDELFAVHLEIASRYSLPLVLHVRRSMHKIFPHIKILKKLPAVVFHSWPGSPEEALSLLRKGIRVFFSFGTTLLLNHKNAVRSCAAVPAGSLLLETDAPYQPLREKKYTSWKDMLFILEAAAAIRKEAGSKDGTETAELEKIADRNFLGIFNNDSFMSLY